MLKRYVKMRSDVLICVFLVCTTLAVYSQVINHEFIDFDDTAYIVENSHVQQGLTVKSICWSFTTTFRATWQPLIWLSFMVDYQFYGLNPSGYLLTNVFLHIANVLLLFLVLKRMTGKVWQSGCVAALFALHPLHVESVAWIVERKDVLSVFFWLLTMWNYVQYAEHRRVGRYLLVLLCFIFGLLAKPVLVTLPFVLLLMDYWPLGRFAFSQSGLNADDRHEMPVLWLCVEKIPLFIIAAASSCVTFYAQQHGGAVTSFQVLPVNVRIANALVSYVTYIGKMLWPCDLAVLYLHPFMVPWWKVAGAGLLFVAMSVLALWLVRKRPYVTIGWLWYVGTLVPVIGLVQFGKHAMADRFVYVPLIGIYILVVWGLSDLLTRWRYRGKALIAAAAVLLPVLMAATWIQISYWSDKVSLFKHVIDVDPTNYVAHMKMAEYRTNQGMLDEAGKHYSAVLRVKPDYVEALYNLGLVLQKRGSIDEAVSQYQTVLRIQPHFVLAHTNVGVAYVSQKKVVEAVYHFSEAVRLAPSVDTHSNLGAALIKEGSIKSAIQHLSEALRLNPDSDRVHNNLGYALFRDGKIDEAIQHYVEALQINHDYGDAQKNLERARAIKRKAKKTTSLP